MTRHRRQAAIPLSPHPAVLHLLLVTLLVLAPLASRLPWWISLVVAATGVWRALVALCGWRMPNGWIRSALAIAGVAAIFFWFGRLNGLAAGSAMLVIATGLKLLELRDRRDQRVLLALLYFTLAVNFLYSQAIWTIVYLFVCVWLITAVLVESNHPYSKLPRRISLRLGAVLTVEALPLMAVMFILFPRIPGPLWGLPADSGAATAGLASSMSPGSIRKLALSDAIAFRVHFDGRVPPPQDRYWRGPVLTHYNGRKWTPGYIPRKPARYRVYGTAVRYEITLEPSRSRWLFALDLPAANSWPQAAVFNSNAVLISAKNNNKRRIYTLVSYPHYVLSPRLSASQRRQNLQLPTNVDPRTRALAGRWRSEGLDPGRIVATALRMYATGHFHYTLEPPPVSRNAIDDFLFNTRAGFCEHFASSFVFLMRAAGIPARVVTGYQGGTKNPYGNYYTIFQNDAHAWAEVWLSGRGWVRFDPTAAASPTRIDKGINAAMAGIPGLPGFLSPQWHRSWGHLLQARWNWLNQQWNHFVLGYGPELQNTFMAWLGLASWRAMILAMTLAITGVLILLGLWLMLATRKKKKIDRALKLWQRGLRRLHHHDLRQQPQETALDFAKRAAITHPELEPWISAVCSAYLHARYGNGDHSQALAVLAKAVRAPIPARCRKPVH